MLMWDLIVFRDFDYMEIPVQVDLDFLLDHDHIL